MRDFALVLIPLFSLVFSSEMLFSARSGDRREQKVQFLLVFSSEMFFSARSGDRREQEVWFSLLSSPALFYRRTVRRPARTKGTVLAGVLTSVVLSANGQETDANGNIDRREQEVWFLLVSSRALVYQALGQETRVNRKCDRCTVRRPARTEVRRSQEKFSNPSNKRD